MLLSKNLRRHSPCTAIRYVSLVAVLNVLSAAAISAAETEADKDVAAVQGQWTRQQQTKRGLVTIVKTHAGQTTTVAALDAAGKLLYEHQSEFKIERAGKLRLFIYFNKVVTAGPDKGKTSNETRSYVYRVVDDHFVEVHGLQEGDKGRPFMVIWKRVPRKKGEGKST